MSGGDLHPGEQRAYAIARDVTERAAPRRAQDVRRRPRDGAAGAGRDEARLVLLVKELEIARHRAEAAAHQERVPRQHEPRDPHAAERHHRHDRRWRCDAAPDEQRDYLTPSSRRPRRCSNLINDILDFSKIEAGRLELERHAFDLRETRRRRAARCWRAGRAERAGAGLDIAPDVPELLLGDPVRLRQVLLNLLGNAVKFTDAARSCCTSVALESADDVRLRLRCATRASASRRQARADLRGVHPGRQLHDAPLRRHRPRPGHRPAARRADGRPDQGRERGRAGQHVPLHGRARPWPRASGRADAHAASGAARAGGGRQRDQPPHLGADAQWRMAPTTVPDAESALTPCGRRSTPRGSSGDRRLPDAGRWTASRWRREIRADHARPTPVVMLTSIGRTEDAARCREIGLHAYLTKPVKHRICSTRWPRLRRVGARRRAELVPSSQPRGALTGPRGRRQPRQPEARDDAPQQARAQRARRRTTAARPSMPTGPRCSTSTVMDVQMPEMGGLEATGGSATASGPAAVESPIVALTAHAMQGDRECCLARRHGRVLTKPIDVQELVATVERFGDQGPVPRPAPPCRWPPPPLPSPAAFDEAAALAYRRPSALKRRRRLFRPDARDAAAHRPRDCRARSRGASSAAHALKGSPRQRLAPRPSERLPPSSNRSAGRAVTGAHRARREASARDDRTRRGAADAG